MRKHVYAPVVLECTLSTRFESNARTLPGQATRLKLEKKLPGIR